MECEGDRFLGCGSAIAVIAVRGCGSAIAFWDVRGRSL